MRIRLGQLRQMIKESLERGPSLTKDEAIRWMADFLASEFRFADDSVDASRDLEDASKIVDDLPGADTFSVVHRPGQDSESLLAGGAGELTHVWEPFNNASWVRIPSPR